MCLSMVVQHGASAMVLDCQALSRPVVDKINGFLRRRNESLGVVVVGDDSFDWATTARALSKPFSLPDLSRAVRQSLKGDQ
jgi:hypothetical protein